MTLRQAVEKVMDYAAAHGDDMNIAYAKMSQDIKSGELKGITQEALDAVHAFLKVHYDEAVAARKGKSLDKYIKALAAWSK